MQILKWNQVFLGVHIQVTQLPAGTLVSNSKYKNLLRRVNPIIMSELCIHFLNFLVNIVKTTYCPSISLSIYILQVAHVCSYLMKPRQEILVICVPVEVDPIVGLYMRSGCLDIPPPTDPAVKAEQGRVAALTSTAVTHLQLARICTREASIRSGSRFKHRQSGFSEQSETFLSGNGDKSKTHNKTSRLFFFPFFVNKRNF